MRSSSLDKDIKGLKRREKFEAENFFKTLQYNITLTFDINSCNRMFCSMHGFINKTLSLNLCHCYLKYRNL